MRPVLKKWVLVFVALWVIWSGTNAFGAETEPGLETAASEDSAIVSTGPPCVYVARFTQDREISGIPAPLRSMGQLIYACHHGMIWQTSEPVQETIVYTRDHAHFRINANRDATRLDDLVHANMASLLLPLMAGDMSELERRFFITVDGAVTDARPRDPATARFLNRITIEEGTDGAAISLIDSRDQKTELSVTQVTPISEFDLEQCEMIQGAGALSCIALLFPQKLAAELSADR